MLNQFWKRLKTNAFFFKKSSQNVASTLSNRFTKKTQLMLPKEFSKMFKTCNLFPKTTVNIYTYNCTALIFYGPTNLTSYQPSYLLRSSKLNNAVHLTFRNLEIQSSYHNGNRNWGKAETVHKEIHLKFCRVSVSAIRKKKKYII